MRKNNLSILHVYYIMNKNFIYRYSNICTYDYAYDIVIYNIHCIYYYIHIYFMIYSRMFYLFSESMTYS